MESKQVPTPPPEEAGTDKACFSRPSPAQAAADAIPLLVDDETYHVFHLTTPPFTRHHPPRLRSSWWRMRSKDLVHWSRDPEPCVVPSSSSGASDADGAWTGAAVQGPDGAMNVFYTGYNLSQNGRQVILRAKAKDAKDRQALSGFSCPGKEIAIQGEGRDQLEDVDFRDPFVFFHAAENRYWMVVAARRATGPYWTRGCVALLTSTDLDVWTFAPDILHQPGDLFCPECPELFFLPSTNKWYLVYSRFHAPNAGTVYRIGDSPYGPFHIPRDGSRGRLDGRRWYAAKSCPKAGDPNARVYFGWTGDYVDDEGKWLWGGDLCVPREVTGVTAASGCLRIDPAAAAVALAEETSHAVPEAVIPPKQTLTSNPGSLSVFPVDLAAANADDHASLLSVAFDVHRCDAFAFGLLLQPDADQRGWQLRFEPSLNDISSKSTSYTVTLLADLAPLDNFWADQYNLHLPRPVDGPEIVRHDHVVLDKSSSVRLFWRGQLVEVFFGGRSISFRLPQDVVPEAVRTHGRTPAPLPERRRFSWFVQDGVIDVENMQVRHGGRLDKIVVVE